MINARTWFTLFIVSLGTVAATASCGSDEAIGGANAGAAGGSIISGAGRGGGERRDARARVAGWRLPAEMAPRSGIECTVDTQCGDGMVCIKANSKKFGTGRPFAWHVHHALRAARTRVRSAETRRRVFRLRHRSRTPGVLFGRMRTRRPARGRLEYQVRRPSRLRVRRFGANRARTFLRASLPLGRGVRQRACSATSAACSDCVCRRNPKGIPWALRAIPKPTPILAKPSAFAPAKTT